jgi:hypothetical protein
MTTLTAAGQTTRLVIETELNRVIAVAILQPQLQHMAGPGFDHRHGDRFAVSPNTCVIPTLRPSNPIAIVVALRDLVAFRDFGELVAWLRFTSRFMTSSA